MVISKINDRSKVRQACDALCACFVYTMHTVDLRIVPSAACFEIYQDRMIPGISKKALPLVKTHGS